MPLGDKLNKKRNLGLLYDVLIQEVALAFLEKKAPKGQQILELVKKYFGPKGPLNEEWQLFHLVESTQGLNRDTARRILDQVLLHGKNMNLAGLDQAKSDLIKEINYFFGKNHQVYNRKIKNYRLFASLHGLLGNVRKKETLLESVEKLQLEETILSYLTEVKIITEKVANKPKEESNNLVLKLMLEEFNKRYDHSLGPRQKKLVEQWLFYLTKGNGPEFQRFVLKEMAFLRKAIDNSLFQEPVLHNQELSKKLQEVRKRINEQFVVFKSMNAFQVENLEPQVGQILEFQELAEELMDLTPEEKRMGLIS